MKTIIFSALLLISISGLAQTKDNLPKVKPDSVEVLPDTVVLKIPGKYVNTFFSAWYQQDYLHKEYMALDEIMKNQVNKQVIKKPK